MYYVLKIILTAGLVVAVSEASKRSSLLGGLFASLPLVSFNGEELTARDGTIKKAGKVGLWTKADAVTNFDDFRVRVAE